MNIIEKIESVLNEGTIAKEIDFKPKKGFSKTFKIGSKEYRAMGNFSDADYNKYVKDMASKGITIKYDEAKDTFHVSSK